MPRKMSGGEAHHLKILRTRAYHAQGGRCWWCSEVMCTEAGCPRQCTAEHVEPVCVGGRTRPGNIVAACAKCNNERNPENSRGCGGLVATTGETVTHSPFAVLGVTNLWP